MAAAPADPAVCNQGTPALVAVSSARSGPESSPSRRQCPGLPVRNRKSTPGPCRLESPAFRSGPILHRPTRLPCSCSILHAEESLQAARAQVIAMCNGMADLLELVLCFRQMVELQPTLFGNRSSVQAF
ncbi:hypothetical protein EJB05_23918, partial [Eragrostis curvula]